MQVLKKIMERLILFSLLSTNKIPNLMKNETKLDENEYKADFAISENYIKFSSELLRLSLLAIFAYSTLFIKEFAEDSNSNFTKNNITLLTSIIFFFLSSSASLFHRYFATDALTWFIQWRRYIKNDELEKAEKERIGLKKMLKKAKYFLILCEVTFASGVLLFLISIIILYTT